MFVFLLLLFRIFSFRWSNAAHVGSEMHSKDKKHCKLNSAPGRGQSLFEMIWLENLDNFRNRELQGSQWITQTMKELKM